MTALQYKLLTSGGNRLVISVSFISDKDFNQRKNNSVLFVGVVDGLNYLLDANDEGSYRQKGTHFMIICTEDMLRVSEKRNLFL